MLVISGVLLFRRIGSSWQKYAKAVRTWLTLEEAGVWNLNIEWYTRHG